MTALAQERLTKFGGLAPSRGSYPIAANTRVFKGSVVALDSSGRAIPGTTIASGAVVCVGKNSSTIDNRTGSALGGAAAAADVEVEFGVYYFANGDSIAATDVGKVAYLVDDQTVAKGSNSGARVPAGVIVEYVDANVVGVYMGPHVSALLQGDGQVQRRVVTVGHADLTAAAVSEAIAIGAPLPANAHILGASIALATPFSGGGATSCVVDIGSTGDADAIVDGSNVFAAAVDGQASTLPAGIAPNKVFSSATQLNATFISDVNVAALSAGSATVEVLFAVIA
jgi:hypothetical protein